MRVIAYRMVKTGVSHNSKLFPPAHMHSRIHTLKEFFCSVQCVEEFRLERFESVPYSEMDKS